MGSAHTHTSPGAWAEFTLSQHPPHAKTFFPSFVYHVTGGPHYCGTGTGTIIPATFWAGGWEHSYSPTPFLSPDIVSHVSDGDEPYFSLSLPPAHTEPSQVAFFLGFDFVPVDSPGLLG